VKEHLIYSRYNNRIPYMVKGKTRECLYNIKSRLTSPLIYKENGVATHLIKWDTWYHQSF